MSLPIVNGQLTPLLLWCVNILLGFVIALLGRAHGKMDEEIKLLRSKMHQAQVDIKALQTREDIWDRKERRK